MSEISSQIRGNLGALYQQGIDAYGIQREIVISRSTIPNSPVAGKYSFRWELTIYMHPGIRRVFSIITSRSQIEPATVMKLAARIDKLTKYQKDWFQFHNYALQSDSLKGVLYLLKRFGV
jgi:hypothetical protein